MDIKAIKEEPDSDIERLSHFDHQEIKKEDACQDQYKDTNKMEGGNEICKLLSNMKLLEKSAISLEKFKPEYILHLDAQPSSKFGSDAKLVSTSSDCIVRIYSRDTLALSSTIKGEEKQLTGVKFSHSDPHILYTSSNTADIRCWDLRTKPNYACQTFIGHELVGRQQLTCFDNNCDDTFLCAGSSCITVDNESEAHLIFWDCRQSNSVGVYKDSHGDDITQVKFHPSKPDRLVSGSMDGLVCSFDISEDNEDDALQTTFNSETSVAKVGWCGKDSADVYCITHVETLLIWNTETMEDVASISGLREAENIDYLVDCFQPVDHDKTMLVAGNNNGHMNVMEVLDGKAREVTSLEKGHSEIVRCVLWDDHNKTLVSGGEDAMLCLWSANAKQHAPSTVSAVASKQSSSVQKRYKQKAGPYSKKEQRDSQT